MTRPALFRLLVSLPLSTPSAYHALQEVTRIDPTFAVTRETVRADVFKDSFAPPSMSFEEWGDIVTAKRVDRETREAAQAAAKGKSLETIHSAGLEGEGKGGVAEEEYDEATRKARRMDDWKDLVVKGSGNTKRI